MIKILSFLLIFLAYYSKLYSQTDQFTRDSLLSQKEQVYINLYCGSELIKFDEFSNLLKQKNFSDFNGNFFYLGLGFNTIFRQKYYLGYFIDFSLNNEIQNNEVSISQYLSKFGFEIGYLLFKSSYIFAVPLAGYVFQNYFISSFDKSDLNNNFEEIVLEPSKETSILQQSNNIKLSLLLLYDILTNNQGKTDFLIGIEGGMLYQFGYSSWEYKNLGQIIEGPLPSKEKFYLSLKFYVGGSK